jgi:adenine-specific DNA-methyltransferase
MSTDKKSRLELTWIGKENRKSLEPRILLEDSIFSYHATYKMTNNDIFDNRLIQGDNLLGLKALEAEYIGKIKCIFIDPPYNTGSAFTHYDDGLEHSIWLSMMRERLSLLRQLLSEDGTLWITIDDNEAHYLKVLCDEIFGRTNFIANIVWEKAYTSNQTAKFISNTHDHILCYAKENDKLSIKKLDRTQDQIEKFTNSDGDHRGPWKAENLSAGKFYAAGQFPITGPTGGIFLPPKGRYWRCNESQYTLWLQEGRITFGKNGTGRPMLKKFLNEIKGGITPSTWWPHTEAGSNKEASLHTKSLFGDEDVFQSPKPEKLIRRIIGLSTDKGDIVLDSFAGSGTTGAVAHKMGRRWIMIELGDHAKTHIVPRLKKVIDGKENGGISKEMSWKGGGGFRFYRLAPSLMEKDYWSNWIINKSYNAAMLAEALCKLEGFTYLPNDSTYWQHGFSSETDFIYVTTATLNQAQLSHLSEEVGNGRTLLIMCSAFRGKSDFINLTIKKIPKQILSKCEWAKDDYSLIIDSLPQAPSNEGQPDLFPEYPRQYEQND